MLSHSKYETMVHFCFNRYKRDRPIGWIGAISRTTEGSNSKEMDLLQAEMGADTDVGK